MEGNEPIQGAFGSSFRIETPNLDRVTQQIQQNYAARNAYLQKESDQTDEVLNKEMANVRSVDTPDIIDAYNDYKNSKQNQLFNKGLQFNPKAYATAQMDANAKFANLMGMINKSTQYNQFAKQMAAARLQKPDNFSDDFGDKLSLYAQTPMDKLTSVTYGGKPMDLTNMDNWKYAGGNFDFPKLDTTSRGKAVTHYDDGTTDATGVQTTQHGYSYGNTPGQYRNTYLSGLSGAEASRGARYSWNQHSANQQQLDQLDAAYQNSPNWQKLGIPPQTLPPYNPADPVGNEATYQAKQYLVSMNPAEVQAKAIQNRGALANLTAKDRLNGQEIMAAINTGDKAKLLGLQHDYKTVDTQTQSKVLDDTVNGILADAIASPPGSYKSAADGQVTKMYNIKAGPELKLAMPTVDAKGHKYPADGVQYDPVNKTVTPVYYQRDANEDIIKGPNGYKPVTSDTQPMTVPEFKVLFGKTYFGTREAAKETTPPATKTITDFRSKYNY